MTIVFYADNKNQEMMNKAERLFNKVIRARYNIEGARCEHGKDYILMYVEVKPEHAWEMKQVFLYKLCRVNEWNTCEDYHFSWTM